MSFPTDDPPGGAPAGDLSAQPAEAAPAYGAIRWQEPGVTVPRPPTVAEARQREKMRKAQEAAEEFARTQHENAEARAATRKKILIGSVAAIGLVGAVALGYQLMNRGTVDATCVKDGSNEVVPDSYCAAGHSSGGGVFIFAGSPYRYYYGGNNRGVGTIASGGSLSAPSNKTAKTKSGTTVSRGGFGAGKSGSGS